MRLLDAVCNFLAILAGIYLVAIMFGIVIQATLRLFNYSGSSHIFTFSEYGLLYIVMAASPWLVRLRGHVLSRCSPRLCQPILAACFRAPLRCYVW